MIEEMDSLWIPVFKSWRLNERHYGALQGLNKKETAEKHGAEQTLLWRRSFSVPPPNLPLDDERSGFDRRYADLPIDVMPKAESLMHTSNRVLPYWHDTICPAVLEGKRVVVVGRGNSLRALVKFFNKMDEDQILKYNIPTAQPFVFEFDSMMRPLRDYYLTDESHVTV